MTMIPFNKPYVFSEGLLAITEAMGNGKLSGDGPNSQKCVKWFDQRFGFKRCLMTPSCTAALELAALLLDVGPEDEVIVPSFTFVTSASSFALRGVKLVFADSAEDTPNVSVDDILAKVTQHTKAIVVVHYAGVPVDMSRLLDLKIPIVEDCAHAIGSVDPVTGKYAGTQGVISTFSFHETKNIPVGEGGMVVINDDKLWEAAQIIREKGTNRTRFFEGKDHFYTWHTLGSSFLLSDVDAGVLWGNLQHYDELQDKRKSIWEDYNRLIVSSPAYKKPSLKSLANAHMYYLQFPCLESRNAFTSFMKTRSILTATHYLPLDQCPFVLKENKKRKRDDGFVCKEAQTWANALVRLPMFYTLSHEEVCTVAKAVNDYAKQQGLVLKHVEAEHEIEEIRRICNAQGESLLCKGVIEIDTHHAFMQRHMKTYRVAIKDGKVVGFVGHVDNDFRFACDPSCARQGVAQFMWNEFRKEYPDVTVQVNRDNKASMSFFSKQGFKPDPNASSSMDPVPLVLA
jgi:dTDP-4-amino-4,6-dideoxygalactose transaminase